MCLGHHGEMLNVTTRLAIRIESTPDWFDWSDQSSQGCRSELKAVDILPDMKDVYRCSPSPCSCIYSAISRARIQKFTSLESICANL